jgi:hypothetical protein
MVLHSWHRSLFEEAEAAVGQSVRSCSEEDWVRDMEEAGHMVGTEMEEAGHTAGVGRILLCSGKLQAVVRWHLHFA